MAQQTVSVQDSAYLKERAGFRLFWLGPALAALIYPFVLDAFHAAITR